MIPEAGNYGIEAWANVTRIHPVGLGCLFLLGIATLFVDRRYALVPFIALACIIPSGQRVVIASVDWSFIRIMVLFVWIRILMRREYSGFTWVSLDYAVLVYWLLNTIPYVIRIGSVDAVVNRMGFGFDLIGAYFAIRCLVYNWNDLRTLGIWISAIAMPVSVLFFLEWLSGRNLFFVMGGVPPLTIMREGARRCQGAFSHPILAGSFWVVAMPIMLLSLKRGTTAIIAVGGLVASLAIIYFSRSSTSLAGALLLIPFVLLRRFDSLIRPMLIAAIPLLVIIHFARERPVWHLISRIDLSGGSTGWHRYFLMDRFIVNWSDWLVFGFNDTSVWGQGLGDVTNQYVLEGILGGILGLCGFVSLFVISFILISRGYRTAKAARDAEAARSIWMIGSGMALIVVIFLAVSFFGQILFLWYMMLALCGFVGAYEKKMASQPLMRSFEAPLGGPSIRDGIGGLRPTHRPRSSRASS